MTVLDQDWQQIVASQIAHSAICAAENIRIIFSEHANPSVLYRPALSLDGNQWCALYGANLQDGVAGFGDTPALAMREFDTQWFNSKASPQVAAAPATSQAEPEISTATIAETYGSKGNLNDN